MAVAVAKRRKVIVGVEVKNEEESEEEESKKDEVLVRHSRIPRKEHVNFRFFGRAADLMGTRRCSKPDFLCRRYSFALLKAVLWRQYFPELSPVVDALQLAVNETFVFVSYPVVVNAGDTISILPELNEAHCRQPYDQNECRGTIRISFWGKVGELVNSKETTAVFPCGRYSGHGLKIRLLLQFEELDSVIQAAMLAINDEYVTDRKYFDVKDGDHVAVIPPLSGG